MTTKNQVLTQNDTMGDLVAHEDGHFTNRMSVIAKADAEMGQFLKVDGSVQVIDLAKEDGSNLALCAGVATKGAKTGDEVVCISGQVTLVANYMSDAKTLVDAIVNAADAQAYKAAVNKFNIAVANMKRFGIKLVLSANADSALYPKDTANGEAEFDPATLIK